MTNTDQQLSEALTALSVAERTAVEAVLNRVAYLFSTEQLARLVLADKVSELEERLVALEGGPGRYAAE